MKVFINDWVPIISLGFSLIAIGLTLFQMWRTRVRVTVTFGKTLESHDAKDMFVLLGDGRKSPVLDNDFWSVRLDIINTTPTPISFFDLRMFSPDSNINYYLMTRKSVPALEDALIFIQDSITDFHRLDIPEKNHGLIPARGYISYDLITLPRSSAKISQCVVSFRIPKHQLFRDPYSVTNRSRFKTYSKCFSTVIPASCKGSEPGRSPKK